MSDSPESVVRKFLAAFTDRNVDELVGFFSDDAVFIDGPRGVHRGKEAIRSEFEAELAMGFESIKIDVNSLVANGGIVMMEGVENYIIGGKPFFMETIGAFDINPDGLITRWRYSCDLKSLTDQIEAAGFKVPT
jgi:limonene-1,2-epoxide hydrolase